MNNTRPPPPVGNPPSYAFVGRVYRSNLRPVVVILALMSGIWALAGAIDLFREINIDKHQGFPKLATFSIVLGAMYAAVAAIGLFGAAAAGLQRLPLVRLYAFLSILSALVTIVAGFVTVVTHFTLKNDMINECTNLTTGADVNFRWSLLGPSVHEHLTQEQANDWCHRAWDHDSWSDIVSLLLVIVLMGLFSAIAFAYYHQLLDPTSPANAFRAPTNNLGAGTGAYYNPTYVSSLPHLGYNDGNGGYNNNNGGYNNNNGGNGAQYGAYGAAPQYAPPPGPPPQFREPEPDDGKLPEYVGAGYGVGAHGAGNKKGDDPFADFEEHDVTSRPRPGENDTFR